MDTVHHVSTAPPGWVGVVLDGTLAQQYPWHSDKHIGEPVETMAERVRSWLAEGREVRVVTHRVYPGTSDSERIRAENARLAVALWTKAHFNTVIPSTSVIDPTMIELWDARAVNAVAHGITGGETNGSRS